MTTTLSTICFGLLLASVVAFADLPSAKQRTAMPAIALRATPSLWLQIHRESEKNPAVLLEYLDQHIKFMEKHKTSRVIAGASSPDDQFWLETRVYVFNRLGDVGTLDLLPAVEQFIERRHQQNDWLTSRDVLIASLAIERVKARAQGIDAYKRTMLNWVTRYEDYPDSRNAKGAITSAALIRMSAGIRALARLHAVDTLPAIMEALKDARQKLPRATWLFNRPVIAHQLAQFGHPTVLDELRENLGLYRLTLADYHLEPEEADPIWAYWDIRTRGLGVRETVRLMLEAAGGKGPSRGISAVLSHMGVECIPVLLDFLQNPPESSRPEDVAAEIIGALGNLRAKEALPYLLHILETGSRRLQRVSATALGQIRDPSALPELMEAAKSTDFNLQMSAIDALGEIGDPRAEPLLVELLSTHPNASVRYAAAQALGRAGTPACIAVLEERMRVEPDKGVRSRITNALEQLRRR